MRAGARCWRRARARDPPMPGVAEADADDPRTAIDVVPLLECVVGGVDVSTMCDVPEAHVEHWAEVNGVILGWLVDAARAGDARRIATAARWFFARSSIFLRAVRGGVRGRARMASRFRAFREERYADLVSSWRADVGRGRARNAERAGRPRANRESIAQQAVRLVRDLEPARAVDRLLSLGLADVDAPEIRAQAEAKHPQRRGAVLADWQEYITTPGGAAALPRVELGVEEVMRALRRRKGAGVTGVRNEQ